MREYVKYGCLMTLLWLCEWIIIKSWGQMIRFSWIFYQEVWGTWEKVGSWLAEGRAEQIADEAILNSCKYLWLRGAARLPAGGWQCQPSPCLWLLQSIQVSEISLESWVLHWASKKSKIWLSRQGSEMIDSEKGFWLMFMEKLIRTAFVLVLSYAR